MNHIKFNTFDLNIQISEQAYATMMNYRQLNEDEIEKGGLLMGQLFPYENTIIITNILASNDSDSDRHNIKLNIECLQNQMNIIWEESKGTITYIGDWHTHPQQNPRPSFIDYQTFFKNFYTSKFDQNILLYLILGSSNEIWSKSFNGFLFKEFSLNKTKKF